MSTSKIGLIPWLLLSTFEGDSVPTRNLNFGKWRLTQLLLVLLLQTRVAKYEGYIHVRILAGWGKKFSPFREDLHNLPV